MIQDFDSSQLAFRFARMLLSRAQAGGFDVIVMSREFADAYRADTVCGLEGVRVIEVDQTAGEVAA